MTRTAADATALGSRPKAANHIVVIQDHTEAGHNVYVTLMQMCICTAGEFAEAVRDQFLNERIEYYKDLETAIANAAAADGTDMCSKEHVKAGLLHLDPDMADHMVSHIT